MRCPRCQHENQAGAKFCQECGTSLARKCANCRGMALPGALERAFRQHLVYLDSPVDLMSDGGLVSGGGIGKHPGWGVLSSVE